MISIMPLQLNTPYMLTGANDVRSNGVYYGYQISYQMTETEAQIIKTRYGGDSRTASYTGFIMLFIMPKDD